MLKAILSNVFSNGASKLVEAVGSAIDKNTTTEDEKEKNKAEITGIIQSGIFEMQKQADDASNQIESQLTERLRIDMTSDSWLSKNIRPLSLIFFDLLFLVMVFADRGNGSAFYIQPEYKDILKVLMMMVNSFYFVGREITKNRSLLKK